MKIGKSFGGIFEVNMEKQELIGFWEVVDHKPFTILPDLTITKSTFALEKMAVSFAKTYGGTVRHRRADGILLRGRFEHLTKYF